ncbi:MAG: cytochrome c1 [Gammaproteobacteria bacterium]|nr:cytochrome c1 [Gammaproteobacteria bacterium]
MAIKRLTTKLGILLTIIGLSVNVLAAGGEETLSANIKSEDKISLQNGATTYMNYCLACHSLKHMRYDKLVDGPGIPADIVENNLMFTGKRITDHITNNLPADAAKEWFGIVPPDLTLVARVRGADWLYTYMKSFYADDKRPFGVNNTLFKDVGMPHILAPLQGKQVKTNKAKELESKIEVADIEIAIARRDGDDAGVTKHSAIFHEATGALAQLKHDKGYFEISIAGSLTEEEYNTVVRDLVNFLDYAGEPVKLERQALGMKVILFLMFFFVLTYFLKKEYWRDIH